MSMDLLPTTDNDFVQLGYGFGKDHTVSSLLLVESGIPLSQWPDTIGAITDMFGAAKKQFDHVLATQPAYLRDAELDTAFELAPEGNTYAQFVLGSRAASEVGNFDRNQRYPEDITESPRYWHSDRLEPPITKTSGSRPLSESQTLALIDGSLAKIAAAIAVHKLIQELG